MRFADYLFETALERGFGAVFGITGRGSLHLTDAVARNERLPYFHLHHEQSAGYAAHAYTMSSRGTRMGICLVSSGVGATNAVSPLLCAWQDQLPVLFISGQNFSQRTSVVTAYRKRSFGEQEADIMSIISSITNHSKMLLPDDDLKFELSIAFDSLVKGRPGPVWLDVPLDVQSQRV